MSRQGYAAEMRDSSPAEPRVETEEPGNLNLDTHQSTPLRGAKAES
ncbi:MAG: hypothetical protein RBS80_26660 [Thermoguttaceae bacterium]|nr:hypothetical protein [Thermoguttaceae bacterium]